MSNLIEQQVKEETDLLCYVWAIAKHFPEDDLTSTGVETIRGYLAKGLSVREAVIEFANI